MDTSANGEVNMKVEGAYKCPNHSFKLNTEVFGNSERAKLQMTSALDSQTYNMVVEGTRNSLFVDTNVYKHILINASVRSHGSPNQV